MNKYKKIKFHARFRKVGLLESKFDLSITFEKCGYPCLVNKQEIGGS